MESGEFNNVEKIEKFIGKNDNYLMIQFDFYIHERSHTVFVRIPENASIEELLSKFALKVCENKNNFLFYYESIKIDPKSKNTINSLNIKNGYKYSLSVIILNIKV